jgi:hypothetical protein
MILGVLLDYCDESGYIYIGMVDRPTCHITFQHSPTVRTGSTANIKTGPKLCEDRRVGLGLSKPKRGDMRGEATVPGARSLLQSI